MSLSTVSGLHAGQGSSLGANYQTQASSHNYQQSVPQVQYTHQQSVQYQQPAQVQYQQPAQYQQTSQQHYHQAPQQQYQQASYQPATQTATRYSSVKSPQEPIVSKHFYVHAAPEEPEDEAGPRFVPIGRSQKTYKIIFIKAPNYSLKSQVIPVLPQNEEKTIVYVLSKKPDFDQNIQLPEPTPTEPSKPEVFFVKYKTQEEADRAQKEIQGSNCITFDKIQNKQYNITKGC